MDYTGQQLAPAPAYTGSSNFTEIVKRIIKYLVEGFVVALAAYFIPQRTMQLKEILMIAISAAFTFALLDIFAPAIGDATRTGAGFGIGATLVGWPGIPF